MAKAPQTVANNNWPGYDPIEREIEGGAETKEAAPSSSFDLKDAGQNYDERNRGLRYGKCTEAPRIT